MFESYRRLWAQKQVLRQLAPRAHRILNYAQVHSVVLTAALYQKEDLLLLESYATYLKEQLHISKIKKIVFLAHPQLLPLVQGTQMQVFTPKETSFWKGTVLPQFLKDLGALQVDLLVDFSNAKAVAIKSIVAAIPATCKVARLQEDWKTLYDLCIELPEDAGLQFVQELQHFLSILNTNTTANR